MSKRIPYKIVSEQLQNKLQSLHHDYDSLKNEVTVLKEKLNNYEPYIDIINKYNIHDKNILEHKLKKINEIENQDNEEKKEEKQSCHEFKEEIKNKSSTSNIFENDINGDINKNILKTNISKNEKNKKEKENEGILENSSSRNFDEIQKESSTLKNISKNIEASFNNNNYYKLDSAIKLFNETINCNDNIFKQIENEDLRIIAKDIYINNYNKIKTYNDLYEYYIETDNIRNIEDIDKIYKIDTENKKKKLKSKINRCYLFIKAVEELKIINTSITSTFLIRMKTKDFNEFINYIEKYN